MLIPVVDFLITLEVIIVTILLGLKLGHSWKMPTREERIAHLKAHDFDSTDEE